MQWRRISSGNVIVFVSSIVVCSVQISAVVEEDDPPEPPIIKMLPSSRRMEDANLLAWVICFVFVHAPASYFKQDFTAPDHVPPPHKIIFPLTIWAMWLSLPVGRSLIVGQWESFFRGFKLSTEDNLPDLYPPNTVIMGTGNKVRN